MWGGGNPDDEEVRKLSIQMALARHSAASAAAEEEEEDDSPTTQQDEDTFAPAVAGPPMSPIVRAEMAAPNPPTRGKPEAMAAKLASASRLQEKMEELEKEKEEVVAVPLDDSLDMTMETVDTVATLESPKGDSAKEASKKKVKRKAPSKKKASPKADVLHPTMDDPTPGLITDSQYQNLDSMMVQFCRVPLLAEFSRPVALLHPELMAAYTKIVEHPIDLGYVCRKIRRREYDNLREIRLDAWRIFSNCVRYHSHSSNKEAVPSFVSIAMHLRDYFNALWQEYMMASDPPPSTGRKTGPEVHAKTAFAKRQEDRKKRLIVSGLSCMAGKAISRAADTLGKFIEDGGCIDGLDVTPIMGVDAEEQDDDLSIVQSKLFELKDRLLEMSTSNSDYGIDELERDVKKCYTDDVFEENPALRMKVAHRLDRWIGKIVVPIYEATCRGVSQSSIWGCMAAAVWARESSKKPFWPALVLGIMAPDHQREDWHSELTLRNETRLPEKLQTQLVTGKRKAEASLKKQKLGQMEPQSHFLVEFLGTHEFIWVREADIIEEYDPADDPNQHVGPPTAGSSKKKRASRSNIANITGSKMYNTALQEAKWALEEFELQLQDVGVGTTAPEEEDDGYSFPVLCQSDEEADIIDVVANEDVDVDELNELLATDGLIDFTSNGRKNAKKRAQALKKQKINAEKKQKADKVKKMKAEQLKKKKDAKAKEKEKERESKKEQRDLDRRRKKRMREREKALKLSDPNKKRKLEPEDLAKREHGRRNLIASKRERAIAIVNGYLNRSVDRKEYGSLCLGGAGVMNIPATMIDSTGLLGMALAFRAAAGDIPMPEESGAQKTNVKAWDAIEVDTKRTSKERMEALQEQAALMEKEIARLKASTARRKALTEKEREVHLAIQIKVVAGDDAARSNPIEKKRTPSKGVKRKKSPAKTPGGSTVTSDMEVESHADTTGSNDGEKEVRVVEGDEEETSGDEGTAESVGDDNTADRADADADDDETDDDDDDDDKAMISRDAPGSFGGIDSSNP